VAALQLRKFAILTAAAAAVAAAIPTACRGGLDPSKHSFGVSFNYDKVCGCVEPEERDPILYNNTYLERFRRAAPWIRRKIDVEGVKQLLDTTGVTPSC
jgi:hypothetical protein